MENTKSQNESVHKPPIAFFLMPAEILKGIHEELSELLGPDVASRVIYNCGVRSGRHIIKDMDINFPDEQMIIETLPELWLQMGIGVFNIEELGEDAVIIKCLESNEAMALGYTGDYSCYLTSGMLAGMISEILGKEFECKEKSCLCKGDAHCLYQLLYWEE